jgi:hypothetical protein
LERGPYTKLSRPEGDLRHGGRKYFCHFDTGAGGMRALDSTRLMGSGALRGVAGGGREMGERIGGGGELVGRIAAAGLGGTTLVSVRVDGIAGGVGAMVDGRMQQSGRGVAFYGGG